MHASRTARFVAAASLTVTALVITATATATADARPTSATEDTSGTEQVNLAPHADEVSEEEGPQDVPVAARSLHSS